MFRATCDKRVTTSAARQLIHSKPVHPEMPAGKPDVHQPRPRQPLPHHREHPRLIATHQAALSSVDNGDEYRVIVAANDSRVPGSPNMY
jgi:hypothetical protein